MNIMLRAWDKVNKRMLMFDKGLDQQDEYNLLYFRDCPLDVPVRDNLIFMQFTGLKDKNKKRIYEGDIIKDSIGVREVKIGNFIFTDPDGYSHNLIGVYGIWHDKTKSPFYSTDKDLGIIGNIYENPNWRKHAN